MLFFTLHFNYACELGKETTPQPLYNTIVGVQANFRVNYPIRVIMYSFIGKKVFKDHLGSSTDPCCIQTRVITNGVIKRLRCSY